MSTFTDVPLAHNTPRGWIDDKYLSKLILFGEGPLRRALQQYVTHYHEERNHQGKQNRLLFSLPDRGTSGDKDVLQLSGLLAGDVKESRNGNPTRDLQMAADRTRPHTLCGPVVSSLFSFTARC
jgi:hypothetical protein